MLAATGEAVLSNRERYGAYLDAMTSGKARARLTVEQPSNRLRHGRAVTPEPRVPRPRPKPTPKEDERSAHILDDPEELRELRKKAEQRDRKGGRHLRRSRVSACRQVQTGTGTRPPSKRAAKSSPT